MDHPCLYNNLFNTPVLLITEKCDTGGADGIGTICKCNYIKTSLRYTN